MAFEIRRNVLEVLNTLAKPCLEQWGAAKFAEGMGKALRYIHEQLKKRQPVPYQHLIIRLAFLCSHVPVNADALAWIMEGKCYWISRFMHRKLLQNRILRVWALGGGPGTELLAMFRQLERTQVNIVDVPEEHLPLPIEFTAYDREPRWGPVFNRMNQQLDSVWAAKAQELRFRFAPAPRLLYPDGPLLPDNPPDLYFMSYVLSENTGELVHALKPVVASAPKDAMFVLTDMLPPERNVVKEGMEFLEQLGLWIQFPRLEGGYGDICTEYNMHMHEDVELMEPYYTLIKEHCGGWELRRNSDVFWLVASKEKTHPVFLHE
jgi:hypothetical protein